MEISLWRSFIRHLVATVVLFITACTVDQPTPPPVQQSQKVDFQKLKSLEGEWVGTVTHGDNNKQSKPTKESVRYKVRSGGQALEEELFAGTDHEMLSVYYPTGNKVEMTHYCMLGNQPILEATQLNDSTFLFTFVRGENINPAVDHHIHQVKISFLTDDRIRQEWIGHQNGTPGEPTVVELTRKKGKVIKKESTG